jgi:DNA-binding response OmpR family regulator
MEQAFAAIAANLRDLARVDIGLPGTFGIEGIRLLKQRYPGVIAVVCSDDRPIFEALCAGASGYLLKENPGASTRARHRPHIYELTPRELEAFSSRWSRGTTTWPAPPSRSGTRSRSWAVPFPAPTDPRVGKIT